MCNSYESCPVHFRHDASVDDSTDPFYITYVGEWAVYTCLEFRVGGDKELQQEAELIALGQIMGLNVEDRARKLLDKMEAKACSRIVQVGHGSLSDVLEGGKVVEGSEEFVEIAPRGEVKALHDHMVKKCHQL